VILETTVLHQFYAYYYRDVPEILYWRDAVTGKEVDVIVKSPKYQIPVEVEYRQDAPLIEKDGLVEYVRDNHLKWAYLITQRDLDFSIQQIPDLPANFLRVPAHIFVYLLGQAERLLWIS
jgi:predicted AAA+ superfamily ATPase